MADPAAGGAQTPRNSLNFAGQLVLWSVRLRVLGDRQGFPTADTIETAYRLVGCSHGELSIAALVTELTRSARRTLDIRPPCARTLSADEDRVLDLIRCFQRHDPIRPRFIASALVPASAGSRILALTARLAGQLVGAGLAIGGDIRPRTGPVPGQPGAANPQMHAQTHDFLPKTPGVFPCR
jgi:hypothetical protein